MKRGAIFGAVFAILLLVGCESADPPNSAQGSSPRPTSPWEREAEFFPAPAGDVPRPPKDFGVFHLGGGVAGTWSAAPDVEHVSDVFARELFDFYRAAMDSGGWSLIDEKTADDGAWTAGWSKDEVVARLTFAPDTRGERVTLEVEICPPLRTGYCDAGILQPMPDS